MFSTTMPTLKIGDLQAQIPIIQGGMGVGISLAGLAAAVSNEGGIGVISSIGLGLLYPQPGKNFAESNKLALRKEIRKAKALTDGILGLNIMYAITDFDDIVKVALEEELDKTKVLLRKTLVALEKHVQMDIDGDGAMG